MLFDKKHRKRFDPEAEERLRNEIEENGGLEKKDLPAMLLSAYLVFLPIVLLLLGLFALAAFLWL